MNEYLSRQINILHKSVDDYRKGLLKLNALINRIEAVSGAINTQAFKDAIFPFILELEQVNSTEINTGLEPNDVNQRIIAKTLDNIDSLLARKAW